jgi:hypothetical protein
MGRTGKLIAVLGVGIAMVGAAAGCGRGEEPVALPDPVETGTPIEIEPSPTATVDPDATTGFTVGAASVIVTGTLNATVAYPNLGLPALWVPPPGDFAMTWRGGGQQLVLGGVSFTAQQPTSSDRVLEFSILTPEGERIAFTSSAGECLVTISPALPDRMGGTFLCGSIVGSGEGGTSVTVAAQGSFAAG